MDVQRRNCVTMKSLPAYPRGTFGLLLAAAASASVAIGQDEPMTPSTADYSITSFPSEGATLCGRLYRPQNRSEADKLPLLIMAHGYSATINGMVADRYAERFVSEGFAVLLYDHRNFGGSGGEPRQQINIWTQARGYRDAIDYASTLPGIDPARIGIWGDSMSGGEVIVVAAMDHRVKAVIGQVPSCGDDPVPADPDGTLFASIRETFLHGDISATPDNTVGPIPVVSFSPEIHPSMMQPMTAFRWFTEYGGRYGTEWKNWVTHVTPNVPVYFSPGLCVRHLDAALLMIVAYEDEMPYVSSEIARDVYAMAPEPKQLHQIDGGHFGIVEFPSALFDEACAVQVDFLRQYL